MQKRTLKFKINSLQFILPVFVDSVHSETAAFHSQEMEKLLQTTIFRTHSNTAETSTIKLHDTRIYTPQLLQQAVKNSKKNNN